MANAKGDNLNDDVYDYDVFDNLNAKTRVEPIEYPMSITLQEFIEAQKIDDLSREDLRKYGRRDILFFET